MVEKSHQVIGIDLVTWMSCWKLGFQWLGSMEYTLVINRYYWCYNPLIRSPLILRFWDIGKYTNDIKWVVSPTYKWDIPWDYNPLILTNHWNPNFLGHLSRGKIVTFWGHTNGRIRYRHICHSCYMATCLYANLPHRILYMDVSENSGSPKWMVYNGKAYQNGWFGGTTISGNPHIIHELFLF